MDSSRCMSNFIKIFIVLTVIVFGNVTHYAHQIQKRYILLAPRTTVLQLTVGFAIPVRLRDKRQFVVDNAYQQNYDLPFNMSNFQVATYYARTVLNTMDITRETMYVYIMNTLDNLELDGEQCLLRAICEVAHTPFHVKKKNNILEKVAQFVFTPSRRYSFDENLREERGINNLTFGQSLLYAQEAGHKGKNCGDLFPKCLMSIIDLISQKYYVTKQ